MMLFAVVISLGVLLSISSVSSNNCIHKPVVEPDYYWRDYNGQIPSDAVPGGRESNGQITYIGQSYIKNFELLPTTIYQGSREVVASGYGKELRTNKNTKILCSTNLQNFSWIPVNTSMSHLLTECDQIIGGYEIDQVLTIGRINHQGSLIIGKVFANHLPNKGLWIPSGNGKEANYQSFELLSYNCKCIDCSLINVRIK